MTHKKHDNEHQEHHEKKKTAEMKTPEPPKDDALFTDTPPKKKKIDTDPTVRQLEDDLQLATDRMLRAHAELDNYRKRATREMDEIRKYASMDLIRDMLAIWDNMGRALEAVENTHDVETLTEGVKMMHEQFAAILRRHHCERIEAIGQPFDPNIHESISQMPSAGQTPGTVLYETQIGFKLYDRVVRPTQVVLVSGG